MVLGGIASLWILACSVNREGLPNQTGFPEGGVDDDASPDDVSPPVDVAIDRPVDMALDTSPTCEGGPTFHRCANVCVSNNSLETCGSSCTACPVPRNGTATCDGTACGIACNANYVAQGGMCIPQCNTQCDTTATNVALPGGRFVGTMEGAWANVGSCGGGPAPESVYKLVLTATSDVFVTTHGTAFDTVVYMRRGCCGAEIGCNDDADGRSTSVLAQTAVPPGTYYIFVDGATATSAGMFTVDIFASPTSAHAADACGNPGRISTAPVTGNSCGYRHDYDPQAGCLNMNVTSSLDAVYYFVLDAPSTVTFNTCSGTCIDSVLYVRDVCTQVSSQRSCDDDSCNAPESCLSEDPHQSRVSGPLPAGVHYLVLDTYPNGPPVTCGAFTITPAGIPP